MALRCAALHGGCVVPPRHHVRQLIPGENPAIPGNAPMRWLFANNIPGTSKSHRHPPYTCESVSLHMGTLNPGEVTLLSRPGLACSTRVCPRLRCGCITWLPGGEFVSLTE
jgi:hypothetical protein